MVKLRIYLFWVILISGCAASGVLYTRPTEDGLSSPQLVIFRKDNFVGGGSCFKVRVNGNEVGTLANAGYIQVPVSIGTNRVSIPQKGKDLEINIETKFNKEYFVEYSMAVNKTSASPVAPGLTNISIVFDVVLTHVSDDYAHIELLKLRDSSSSCLGIRVGN